VQLHEQVRHREPSGIWIAMRFAICLAMLLLCLFGGCIIIEKTVAPENEPAGMDAGGSAPADAGIKTDAASQPDAQTTPPPDPQPQPPPTPAQILSAMPFMDSIQGFHLGSCLLWNGGVIKPGSCEARANFVKDPPAPQHQNYGLIMYFTYGATGDEYEFQAWPSFLLTGVLYDTDFGTPVEVLAASQTSLRYRHQQQMYLVTKSFEYIDGALEVMFKYEKPNTPTFIAFAVFE
jgi:hypothetical protein